MDNETYEVYQSDTKGKRINKPIMSKPRTYQNIRDFTECITANIYKPMDWKLFLKLTDSTKKLYISHLRTTYKANDVQLGKMFGIDNSTVGKKCRQLHIPKTKGRQNLEQATAWNEFLNGTATPKTVSVPKEEAPTVKQDASNVKEESQRTVRMSMSKLHLEFAGRLDTLDIQSVAEKLVSLWGNDRDCKVVIDIE